jgi:hypothetical protein
MLLQRNMLLLVGALILGVALFLRPDAVSAQPCHPHMHGASEAPPAAPPREAEAPSPAHMPVHTPANTLAHVHMTVVSATFDDAFAVSGEAQLHAAPFVSMADRSCCGAGCKNARCVGGKSMTTVPSAEPLPAAAEPAPFAVDDAPLFDRPPPGLRKPPRSFV